jgi:selenocysteine-specific elongation factor
MTSPAPIYNVIVGTAGHIDHGKSALVRRLTGIDPDRLPEEQERGMTIDLGFAPYRLRDGRKVGIIDVPGHERFIKNMVAGATSIDVVMLLVAADDGIMPQTREHLRIMTLLGLRRGLVVLNKIDLVDRDLLEVVTEEVRGLVRGTFLEGAPVIPVSATTGEGIERLQEALETLVQATPPRPVEGVFRMPVQRVFSAKGHGTIVTGVPLSGRAAIGDTLEVLPAGRTGRIRGLQAYRGDVDEVRVGHSSAINLADIDHAQVKRGDVVAAPGFFRAARCVDALFRYLPEGIPEVAATAAGAEGGAGGRPLRHLAAIRFHAGSAEVVGAIALLDRDLLLPGEEALVQFRLEEPVVVGPGDYFVARLQSPMWTIGGGRVLGSSDERRRRKRPEVVAELRAAAEGLDRPEARAEAALRRLGARPATLEAWGREAKEPPDRMAALAGSLRAAGRALLLPESRKIVHPEGLAQARAAIEAAVGRHHRESPLRLGPERGALRAASTLDPELFDAALAAALAARSIEETTGAGGERIVRLAGFAPRLAREDEEVARVVEQALREGRFAPPGRKEIHARLPRAHPDRVNRVIQLLRDQGTIAVLKEDTLLHREALDEAKALLVRTLEAAGTLESARFRDLLGTTRKYVIPILEHFDEIGLTVRDGNVRRLKKPDPKPGT